MCTLCGPFFKSDEKHMCYTLALWKRSISSDLHRIESSAIINLRVLSTKLNKYIVFTMQMYKKLINTCVTDTFCYTVCTYFLYVKQSFLNYIYTSHSAPYCVHCVNLFFEWNHSLMVCHEYWCNLFLQTM